MTSVQHHAPEVRHAEPEPPHTGPEPPHTEPEMRSTQRLEQRSTEHESPSDDLASWTRTDEPFLPRRYRLVAGVAVAVGAVILLMPLGNISEPGFFEAMIGLITTTVGLVLAVGSVLFERHERRYTEAIKHLDRKWFALAGGVALLFASVAISLSFRYLTAGPSEPATGVLTPQRLLVALFGMTVVCLSAMVFAALRLTQATLMPSLLRKRALSRPDLADGIIDSLYNLANDCMERRDLSGFRAAALTMAQIADDGEHTPAAHAVEAKVMSSLKGLYSEAAARWSYGTSCIEVLSAFVRRPEDPNVRSRRSDVVAGEAHDLVTAALDQEHPSRRQVELLLGLLECVLQEVRLEGDGQRRRSTPIGTLDKAIQRIAVSRVAAHTPIDVAEQIDEWLPRLILGTDDLQLLVAYLKCVDEPGATAGGTTVPAGGWEALGPCTSATIRLLSDRAGDGGSTGRDGTATWSAADIERLLSAVYRSSPRGAAPSDLNALGRIIAGRGDVGLRGLKKFADTDPACAEWSAALVIRTALAGGQIDSALVKIDDEQHLASWIEDFSGEIERFLIVASDESSGAGSTRAPAEAERGIGAVRRQFSNALHHRPESQGMASAVAFAVLETVTRPRAREQAHSTTLSLFFGDPTRPFHVRAPRFLGAGLADCMATTATLLDKSIARLRTAFKTGASQDLLAPSADVVVTAAVLAAEHFAAVPDEKGASRCRDVLDVLSWDPTLWEQLRLAPVLAEQLAASLELVAQVVADNERHFASPLGDIWVLTSTLQQVGSILDAQESSAADGFADDADESDSAFDEEEQPVDGSQADGGGLIDEVDLVGGLDGVGEAGAAFAEPGIDADREDDLAEPDPIEDAVEQLAGSAIVAAEAAGRRAASATREQRVRLVSQFLGHVGFDEWWSNGVGEAFWSSLSDELAVRPDGEMSIRRMAEGLPWSSSTTAPPSEAERQFLERLAARLSGEEEFENRDVATVVGGLMGTDPQRGLRLVAEMGDRVGKDHSKRMGFWFAMTSMPSPDARMEIIAANAAKIPPRVVEAALKDCTSSQLAALTERLSSGFERRCAGDDDCPALSSFRSIRGRIHRAKRDGRHAPTIEPLGALAAIGHVVRAHRGEVIPNRMMTLTVDAAWSSYGRADTMEWLFGFCRTSFANNTRAVRRATRRCMDVGPTPEFIVAHLLEFSPSALAEWLGSVTPQTSRMFWAAVLRRMESDRSDPPFAVRLARHVEWILRQQGKRELGSRIEIMALYAFVLDVLSQQDPTPLRTSPWVGALVGARGNLDPDPSAVAGRAVTEDWIYTTGCEVADRCERGPEFRRRWRGASKPPQPPQPEPAQPVPAG